MADELPLLLAQGPAARHIGIGKPRLRRWTDLGLVPTFTDPETGRILYPRPALERWAAEMKAAGTQ